MLDYINLNRSPVYEESGDAERYKKLLKKRFPIPQSLKKFVHFEIKDGDVVVWFDDENEDAIDFADFTDFHSPETWDDIEVLEFEAY